LISLNDGRLASSFDDNSIKITSDILTFSNYTTLIGHTDLVNSLVQLEKDVLVSGSCDRTIKLWNLTTMQLISTLTNHNGCINALLNVKLNDNITYLISGSEDKTVNIWSNELKLIKNINYHSDSITSLAYMQSYKILAIGSKDTTISIWKLDLMNITLINTLKYSKSPITALTCFHNSILFIASSDGFIYYTDLANLDRIDILYLNFYSTHKKEITCLININNQYIASGSLDKSIIIWYNTQNDYTILIGSTNYYSSLSYLTVHNGRINSLLYIQNNNESYLVSSSSDTSIIVWKTIDSLTLKNNLENNTRQTNDLIQLENNYLVSASDDFALQVWNNEYLNILTLKGHTNNVYSVVELSMNRMASCSKDKSIIIWNAANFTLIKYLFGHLGAVISLASIVNNNQYLASGSCDKTIIIWDLSNYTAKTILKRHTDCINVLSYYNNNNKLLLSGSADQTVIIWNLDTFTYFNTLNSITDSVYTIIFSYPYYAFGLKNNQILIYKNDYSNLFTLNTNPFDSSFSFLYYVTALAILPNTNIVSGSMSSNITIWQSEYPYELIATLSGHSSSINAI